uniref:Arf-GAP domain-containing protein n=1 Tax=Megaselia scalaris TaxID=36166 RepID=T1GG86_MEGSC
MMTPDYEKLLQEIILKDKNNKNCIDCNSEAIEFGSYNIGIFLCAHCASVHRSMGSISKVKHLSLDKWKESEVERMKEIGNEKAKLKYEYRVPPCYRPLTNQILILIEQWIRAKYERQEFTQTGRPNYISGHLEGFLMKRGKEDARYQPRKFILSEATDTLRYFVKESKEPKAIIRISELNAVLAPKKMEHENSMQLTFMKDGSSRHIYLYHEEGEVIINWYMAIRCAKLHRLQVAYPMQTECNLTDCLTNDFAKEGWILKTGPRPSDGYKMRWFSLDAVQRKLMYMVEPLGAFPKGKYF